MDFFQYKNSLLHFYNKISFIFDFSNDYFLNQLFFLLNTDNFVLFKKVQISKASLNESPNGKRTKSN